jgi:hypothetical protein
MPGPLGRLGLAATCLALGLAGCATGSKTSVGTGDLGTVPASAPATTSATPPATPSTAPATSTAAAPPVAAPLTCTQLKSAEVGSKTVSYNGYHDGIPLGGLGL